MNRGVPVVSDRILIPHQLALANSVAVGKQIRPVTRNQFSSRWDQKTELASFADARTECDASCFLPLRHGRKRLAVVPGLVC